MSVFTFAVVGASPGPGVIVIVTRAERVARSLAVGLVESWNEDRAERGWSLLSLGELLSAEPFDTPCVVYSFSGEG